MQAREIGLKIGCLLIIGMGLVLFLGLAFSQILIPLVPPLIGIFIWYVTKTQRKLVRTETTPIYQIAEGWVKIQGNVSAPKTFVTPYFKQECIAYTYEEGNITYDSESGSEHVTKTSSRKEFQDFHLSNGTGKIKIIIKDLNLTLLETKSDTKHSIKYAVDDIRYTERTLKNGDLISVLGYAVKNSNYAYELTAQANQPLVIATPDFEDKTIKSFRVFKYLMPYLVLMYLSVNYFLFLAPERPHEEQNTAFALLSFFGIPILGVLFGVIGAKLSGFGKDFFSCLGGICFFVALLSFPLLCLLYMVKTNQSTIIRVWASIFICTSLAMILNYRKLEGAFDKD